MRSRASSFAFVVLAAGALATSVGCSGADGENVASGASDLSKVGGPIIKQPPVHGLPPIPLPPPTPGIYVGDANDTATILADEDVFWKAYFNTTDDAEVATFEGQFTYTASPFWSTQQRTSALVQMYDLMAPIDANVAAKYLERLRRIAGAALLERDDDRWVGGRPVDQFRHRLMPAWGGYTADRDGLWNTDVVTAGIFTYAMAAFARRVATNPALQTPTNVADAIRFTSATLESYEAYRPEMHLVDSDAWAYFTVPAAYSTLQCNTGSDDIQHACQNYRSTAGQPLAWNENFSMMKALAEAAVAADSPMYRASSDATAWRLYMGTNEAPLLIAKSFTFFDQNLDAEWLSDGTPIFKWNHQLPLPRTQDTAHGGFELGSLAVLLDDKIPLDDILARNGRSERVALSTPLFTRFANTFLRLIWHYDYSTNPWGLRNILDEKVDGTSNPGLDISTNANEECAGWIPLAQFDPWMWTRCRDATFQVAGALREDNHAALLRYREFAAR